jgi:hypothetical protein
VGKSQLKVEHGMATAENDITIYCLILLYYLLLWSLSGVVVVVVIIIFIDVEVFVWTDIISIRIRTYLIQHV